jgi:hypothetical protein
VSTAATSLHNQNCSRGKIILTWATEFKQNTACGPFWTIDAWRCTDISMRAQNGSLEPINHIHGSNLPQENVGYWVPRNHKRNLVINWGSHGSYDLYLTPCICKAIIMIRLHHLPFGSADNLGIKGGRKQPQKRKL